MNCCHGTGPIITRQTETRYQSGGYQSLDDGQQVTDSFSVGVTTADGESASQTITITINGESDAPSISFEDRATTATGTAPTDMSAIRDFDGNDLGAGGDWKFIGEAKTMRIFSSDE
jgi:hypothetical protein